MHVKSKIVVPPTYPHGLVEVDKTADNHGNSVRSRVLPSIDRGGYVDNLDSLPVIKTESDIYELEKMGKQSHEGSESSRVDLSPISHRNGRLHRLYFH